MTQINLLPWREQARHAQKIRFGLMILAAVIMTLFIALLFDLYNRSLISHQAKRNAFLQTMLDQEGANLGKLNKKKQLLAVMDDDIHYILNLREQGYRVIRLLDALARVVPEGVTLNRIVREENKIVIIGRAQSNIQITMFMKNMTNHALFKQPVLTQISTKENTTGTETVFQLEVVQQG